ncbi:hypothetical protein WMF38_40685 [Sorangium sp. So ce118]
MSKSRPNRSSRPLVTVEDLVVVETDDALLGHRARLPKRTRR